MKVKDIFILCLSVMATLCCFSCKEDANDWPVDPSTDRLFCPTVFQRGTSSPTKFSVQYTGVTDATNYWFELSEGDSLLFNNIVRTVDIIADTLTTTSTSTSVTAQTYITWFDDIKGSTRYSLRMKAIDGISGKESHWISFCFDSPEEQIFTSVVPGYKKGTFYWRTEKEATDIKYGKLLIQYDELTGLEVQRDTVWIGEIPITDAMKAIGKCVITGLENGQNYIATIYNGDAKRGTYKFSTLGMQDRPDVTTIELLPTDDLATLMADAVAAGTPNMNVVLKSGSDYFFEGFNFPEGVMSVNIFGDYEAEDPLPLLRLKEIKFAAPIGSLTMNSIELDVEGRTDYFMNLNQECFYNFTARNCTLKNVNRSFIKLNDAATIVNRINFSDCTIINMGVGGYGFLNINSDLSELSITNCTLREIGDQLAEIKTEVDMVNMDRCIFCNYTTGIQKIWRINTPPLEMSVTNCIFAGTNGGQKVNSGYGDYDYIDYLGSYMTADMMENDKPFRNINKIEMTSDELFVDPRNGDFHIKEGVIFPGDGAAGPSKWWTPVYID